MDLNQMVMDSFAKIQSDGFIEATVEKTLKKTLESAIEDTFRSYSDFGKALREQVEKQIVVDLSELDLKQYNELVLQTVKTMLDEVIRVNGVEQLKERLDDLFGDVKDEYKLSELVEAMKKFAIEYGDSEADGSEITLHVNDPHSILTFVSMDAREDIGEYSCRYRFTVDRDGKIGNVNVNGNEYSARVAMQGICGFDDLLFKLFAHKSKVILDEDDVDVYFHDENED